MLRPPPDNSPPRRAPPSPVLMCPEGRAQQSPEEAPGSGGTSRGRPPSPGPSICPQTGLQSRTPQKTLSPEEHTGPWVQKELITHAGPPPAQPRPTWTSSQVSQTAPDGLLQVPGASGADLSRSVCGRVTFLCVIFYLMMKSCGSAHVAAVGGEDLTEVLLPSSLSSRCVDFC